MDNQPTIEEVKEGTGNTPQDFPAELSGKKDQPVDQIDNQHLEENVEVKIEQPKDAGIKEEGDVNADVGTQEHIKSKTELQEEERALKKELVLRHLEEGLGIVEYACSKVGIGRTTFYKWCDADENFKIEVDKIRVDSTPKKVEDKLLRLIDSDNITAIIFYLKSRHPDYKPKLGLEGDLSINKYDKLTDIELAERIRELTGELGKEDGKEIPALGE